MRNYRVTTAWSRRFTYLISAASVVALLLSAALTGTGASASAQSGPAAQARHLAYDPATGTTVAVYNPAGYATPVHPEQITHPQQDVIGASGQQAGTPSRASAAATTRLPGIDVSSHNGKVNWAAVAGHVDFVYAKATEGTNYHNPDFANQYNGPYSHGVLRGAYHFAIPSNSSGAAQANYFVQHGGKWSRDGRTLPGALDIESNPYGAACYGLNHAQMKAWIWAFDQQYARDTGVYPVLYTNMTFWKKCTGNTSGFQHWDPLWIASYGRTAGALPAGYKFYTFWQHADSGSLPGDQDVFNGTHSRLKAIAAG
jgi:GH25 family lysozyme M1 (1,4-beta-N-acetylmuramidase)